MNTSSSKTAGMIDGVKKVGSGISSVATKTRAIGNVGVKTALATNAAIVAKHLDIAPEATGAVANTARDLPAIIEISTELPAVSDAVAALITYMPAAQDIAIDVQTAANVGAYGGVFGVLYFASLLGFGKKGRIEAGVSGAVWTALAVGLLNEAYKATTGDALDFFGIIPVGVAEDLPEKLRDMVYSEQYRQDLYAMLTGALGIGSAGLAVKNIVRTITGIPKKKPDKPET